MNAKYKKPFLIYGETPVGRTTPWKMCKKQRKGDETIEEVWKPVEGYEGRYEISNQGRLRSFVVNTHDGKILRSVRQNSGYHTVRLYDGNGNSKWYPVHRLVAAAFVPNPMNYPEVNHIDEIKGNNEASNLEWCDRTYNVNYGTRIQRVSESHINNQYLSKKVCSIDRSGRVETYDSIGEAERQTGLHHANIVRTLKGRTNHCGKKQWFYC